MNETTYLLLVILKANKRKIEKERIRNKKKNSFMPSSICGIWAQLSGSNDKVTKSHREGSVAHLSRMNVRKIQRTRFQTQQS